MRLEPLALALLAFATASTCPGDEILFADSFAGKLGDGWTWVREEQSAWRVAGQGLELRVLPGNLWGRANNVKNVLVRALPDVPAGEIELSVTVSNRPTHQYEQANLAWYYDDSHMVKLGLELVDHQVCIVMGREEADKTRTLAKIPLDANSVQLRLRVSGRQIHGQYRPTGTDRWQEAATGELPTPVDGKPKVSLHCYQGPPDAEHWARFGDFQIKRIGPQP